MSQQEQGQERNHKTIIQLSDWRFCYLFMFSTKFKLEMLSSQAGSCWLLLDKEMKQTIVVQGIGGGYVGVSTVVQS